MLKCPKCGSELEYGMRECDFCFRRLTPKELTELERCHFQSDYTAKFSGKFQRKKKKKRLIIIIAAIAAAIALSAGICRLVYHKSIITAAGEGINALYNSLFKGGSQESGEEKFMRLEGFAEQLNEQYKDSDYPKRLYPTYNDYLLYIISVNVETVYPGEFSQGNISVSVESGKITEFKWNGWVYTNHNGYSKIYPPEQ